MQDKGAYYRQPPKLYAWVLIKVDSLSEEKQRIPLSGSFVYLPLLLRSLAISCSVLT